MTNSFQKKRSTVPFLTMFTVLFFWPTYLIPASDFVAQKSFYFIMPFISILVVYVYARRLIIPFESVLFLIFYPLLIHVFLNNLIYADGQKIFLLIKPLFNLMVFIAAVNCSVHYVSSRDSQLMNKGINIIYLLLLLSIFIQYIHPPFFLLLFFNASDISTPVGNRAPGTFEWVYATCSVLGFYLVYCVTKVFVYRKYLYVFPILITLVAVFISQSKVGYVSTIFVVAYLGFLLLIFRVKGAKTLLLCMCSIFVSGIALIVFSGVELTHITLFFDYLTGEGKIDGSTLTRLRQANLAIDTGVDFWFTGKPGSYNIVIENAYLDYIYRYALFGFVTLAFFILTLVGITFLTVKNNLFKSIHCSTSMSMLMSSHITLVSMVLYALAGSPFDGYKISFFIALLFGFLIGYQKRFYRNSFGA